MKAQDLRIGNLVMRENHLVNKYDKVKNHQIVVDHRDIQACVIAPDKFEPIPLTEEWLLKMGFNKDVKGSYRTNHYMFIERWYISHKEKYDKNFFSLIIHEDFITHINAVHQLQNLFHCLTGEELTINN